MNKNQAIYDVIVVGGGPSGMMSAGRASNLGAKVLLLERNDKLGKKLSITGGGRCNITNAEFDVRKFLDNFPQSKNFLFSPFSKFSAQDSFTFFEKKGLALVVEARKRAFPKSQKALDVVKVMRNYVKENKVEVKNNTRVVSIKKEGDFFSLKTKDGQNYLSSYLILATGGLAAPETGSTGDGLNFLQKLGHSIAQPNPNIVPLKTNEQWVHSLSGLSLSFMRIRFIQDGKIKIKKLGKLLFTHFGLSGPLILNSAHEVKNLLKTGPVTASIDLFPDTEENELDRRLWRLFEKNKNKKIKNVLPEILPQKLSETILDFENLNLTEKIINSITKEERRDLSHLIKNLTFEIIGTLGFDKAVIADGGIPPEEINFKNMTSIFHPRLYILGDLLNINRPSGGFSLQLCWTTGWVAGSDVGESIKKNK